MLRSLVNPLILAAVFLCMSEISNIVSTFIRKSSHYFTICQLGALFQLRTEWCKRTRSKPESRDFQETGKGVEKDESA